MKRKQMLSILTLIFGVVLSSCKTNNDVIINQNDKSQLNEEIYTLVDTLDQHPEVNKNALYISPNDITMRQFADFLEDKKEHYPLSDEFIEKYQQASGGYIDLARKRGLVVDKQKHEPNQKWHFFESWMLLSIEEGTLTWEDNARSRVYIGLKSPELLLWIFEAAGVNPHSVRNAMKVAEAGRSNNVNVATIAKNMRDYVTWEEIVVSLTGETPATKVTLPANLEVTVGGEDKKIVASVTPSSTTDRPSWIIIEGSEYISVSTNGNEATIHPLKAGTAKIQVTYNNDVYARTVITINEPIIDSIIGLPNAIDLDLNNSLTLTPLLNYGSGTFDFSSSLPSVASISPSGVIEALSYGSSEILVTSKEYPNLSKVIPLEVSDHGSFVAPLSINEAINLTKNMIQTNGEYLTQKVIVKGKVLNNASSSGGFIVGDLSLQAAKINVNHSAPVSGVESANKNDEVILESYLKNSNGTLQFANKGDEKVLILNNERGKVLVSLGNIQNATVMVNGTKWNEALSLYNGETLSFQVIPNEGYKIDKVEVNDEVVSSEGSVYSLVVAGDMEIKVTASDASMTSHSLSEYNIKYDLGTRKTAKALDTTAEAFDIFNLISEGSGIITSVSAIDKVYGGGNGGRGDTAWYAGDMLKFGTTSANGSITLTLSEEVNQIKITGYTTAKAAKLQLGDAESLDWETLNSDNKTTTITCNDFNETTLDVIEGNLTSTIVVDIARTSNLKIAMINKKPFYLTSIEFILDTNLN